MTFISRSFQSGWTQFANGFSKVFDYGDETGAFGCGKPLQPQPFPFDAQDVHEFPGHLDHFLRFFITVQVMACPDASAAYQYTVGAELIGFENEIGIHSAGAHNADQADVGRVLHPADSRQVRRRVGAPVAGEHDNPWIQRIVHGQSPSIKGLNMFLALQPDKPHPHRKLRCSCNSSSACSQYTQNDRQRKVF